MTTATAQALAFDRDTHTYSLGNRVLPSVTEILKGSGIVNDRWWTEAGKWRGSQVHLACWYDDQNDLDEENLDPALTGYVEAYRKFRSETGFVATEIETPVYNDLLGYAGTPDRIGKLNGGCLCVPDLKSGSPSRVTRYQTVAYVACLPSPRKYVRMEVRLRPEGKYALQVYEPKEYDADFRRWQSIIDVFHLRRELGI